MSAEWAQYRKTGMKFVKGTGQLAVQTGQFAVTAARQVPAIARFGLFLTPLIVTSVILYSYYLFFDVFLEGVSHDLFSSMTVTSLSIPTLLKGGQVVVTSGSTYGARILWTTFTNLHVLLSLTAVVCCCAVFISYFREREISINIMKSLGVFCVCASIIYFFIAFVKYRGLTSDILEATVLSEVGGIHTMNRYVDMCSFATAVFLAITSAVMLVMMADQSDLTVEFLYRSIRAQRALLFVSAPVLVSGIVQLSASLNWALTAFHSTDAAVTNNFKEVVSSLINSRAVYYTFILSAIYAPGMLFLRNRTHTLAKSQQGLATISEREEWLRKNGLLPSYADKLPRFAAILAPLLTGIAAQLVKSFV
jgi:hypothetical protein